MSLHQFFLDGQVLADEGDETFRLRLSAADEKHARVLRLAAGERIAVVDAANDYFVCEIVDATDGLTVRIAEREEGGEHGPIVVLVQGLAKGDKMETVIRHATELGVSGFVPLKCSRSVMKLDPKKAASRVERWRAIAKSAAMQSGRRMVPLVEMPVTISEAASLFANAHAVLVCWEEAPTTARLADALARGLERNGVTCKSDARIVVVVGPEGGLAKDEVDVLLSANPNACTVTLGSTVLRTETAGIVAPALVLYELGGLGNSFGLEDGA